MAISVVSGKGKYVLPTLFTILIGAAAFRIILAVKPAISQEPFPMLGIATSDAILVLLGLSVPVLLVEYYLFAVPLAIMFLFANRLVKAASYDMDIMNIGPSFEGRHMIRRAAAPALFSVASSEMFREVVSNYLSFGPLEYDFLGEASISLMGALLFMPVALLIFTPTWVLNDSGIVTHLKENKLEVRQCPDTQGVGRWVSSIFVGYALIAFPISMFMTYFYTPYIAGGTTPQLMEFLGALTLVVGLPLFVMAFIIPVVGLNEVLQGRIRKRMARVAIRLGGTVVQKETIAKTTRLRSEGILTEPEAKEIISTAKLVNLEKKAKLEEKEISSRNAMKADANRKSKRSKRK